MRATNIVEAARPIELTLYQEVLVILWAKDDRLWTTQETVEFNLRLFARAILVNLKRKRDKPFAKPTEATPDR